MSCGGIDYSRHTFKIEDYPVKSSGQDEARTQTIVIEVDSMDRKPVCRYDPATRTLAVRKNND